MTLLALELLDEARAAGIPAAKVAPGNGNTWGSSNELAESVPQRGLSWVSELPPNWVETLRLGRDRLHNELGLNHFEGRSWRGFHHHACLVVLAHAFQTCREKTEPRP